MFEFIPYLGIFLPTTGSGLVLRDRWIKERRLQWEKYCREQRALREKLLEGTFLLHPESSEDWDLPSGIGLPGAILSGSAAAGIGATYLQTLYASLLQKIQGPIMLIEPDDLVSLPDCLSRIPAAFHNRLLVPKYPGLGGGWGGRSIKEVYAEENRPLWRDDQEPYEERFLSAMRHQPKPPFLLVFISPGPSGSMAWPLVRAYAKEHPTVPIWVIFVLDQDPKRRQRHVGQLLDLYSQHDLVSLFIINDNARGDQHEYDSAIAAFLLSVIQGPWLQQTPKAGWNILGDFHRLYEHKVATLRFAGTVLDANYLGPVPKVLPEVWFTSAVSTRLQLRASVYAALRDKWRQSLALPAADEPWLVSVTSPIHPSEMLKVKHALDAISLANHQGRLLLSSMSVPLTSTTKDVEALTTVLVPIVGGLPAVAKLAANPVPPAKEFQPTDSLIPNSFNIGGNGHGADAKKTTADDRQPIYDQD